MSVAIARPAEGFAAAAAGTTTAERMSIVVAGHVDHGKSTVVGRLLADTGSLPDGKLAQVRAHCARNARPFEYAFLLDALKDEQAQGITIDAARIFFRTARRHYVVIDAPGHAEFLRNMVTGASRAEAALLVIDAREGVRENSRRHGQLVALLGIRQVAVVVNKLDLVGRRREAFERIVDEYGAFLAELGVRPAAFIPVVARDGENLAVRSPRLAWYEGPTVLEALDGFRAEPPAVHRPFRMPVQAVYRFTARGDDRRIVAGTVESGTLRVGDEVVFHPSGKRSRVRTLEAFARTPPQAARAGEAIGFTLDEQIYVARGEVATRADEPPPAVARRLAVSLFWLGREPLRPGRDYVFKLGTARVPARLEAVVRTLDAAALRPRTDADRVERHEVADCILALARPVAMDVVADQGATSRFVLVDDYDVRGGGIVREALPDADESAPDPAPAAAGEPALPSRRWWTRSRLAPERRTGRHGQRATLLVLTGADAACRDVARLLETRLLDDGRLAYEVALGELRRAGTVQRLADIVGALVDAGLLVVARAPGLTAGELAALAARVDRSRVATVTIGAAPGLRGDLALEPAEPGPTAERILDWLRRQGRLLEVSRVP